MNNEEINNKIFNLKIYEKNVLNKGVIVSASGICMMALAAQDDNPEVMTAGVTLTTAGIAGGVTAFNIYNEIEQLEKSKTINKPKRLVKNK